MGELALHQVGRPAVSVPRVWGPELRLLSVGLVSTITLVALESLAVLTVAPMMSADLRGLNLYGWVTGAFFLTTVVGLVLAGTAMDRAGPARPLLAGLLVFGLGLALAASAPSMPVVIVGRSLQGLGSGAMTAVNFGIIGQRYPPESRPRMFAVIATAWVVPSLGGPGLAAVVADHVGWRWVFGGLVPLVGLAGIVTLWALRAGGAPPVSPGEHTAAPVPEPAATAPDIWPVDDGRQLLRALCVAAGSGLVLAGLTSRAWYGIPLVAAGLMLGIAPLRRLVPAGTLRARRGAPAAVALRGMLSFTFFGTDTFIPLTVTSVRHASTTAAGLAVTTAAIVWTAGSWTQARLSTRRSGRFLVLAGTATMVTGIVGATATLLFTDLPLPVCVAFWGVAGFGIGMAYSPVMNIALNAAPPGRQGAASSATSLTDNLGVAFGSGISGVAVATGGALAHNAEAAHAASVPGLAAAFAITTAVGLVTLVTARRLPATVLGATGGTDDATVAS